jgi:predicted phosphodiesterase
LNSGTPDVHMHEVHVCGLKAATTYYYQAGGGPSGGETWSATQSFTTAPASGSSLTFGFSGDSRDGVTTLQAAQMRMRDAAVNLQVYSGDFVFTGSLEVLYTSTDPKTPGALDVIWKDPNDPTKFLTLGQQMIVAVAGNHENEAAEFFSNFPMPAEGPYAKTYASFNAGPVHFVMFDDEQLAVSAGSPLSDQAKAQVAWVDADLAAADMDRAAHPFVVFVSHRGLYSTSMHGNDPDVLFVRSTLAPLFDKYHVDVVLNGHDHEYEATHPLNNGAVAAQGTIYIVNGGAGSDPYSVAQATSALRASQTTFGPAGNTPGLIGVYGVATADMHTLTLKSYGLKAGGKVVADDMLIDTVTVTH